MDSQDPRAAIRKITSLLRKVTRIIQLIPFVYLAVYSLSAFSETQMSEELLCLRDSILAVSPVVNTGFLLFSRLLELCRWHKIACFLSFGTPAADYVDCYLFQFTQTEVVVINMSLAVVSVIFLLAANYHFFGKHEVRHAR